MKSWDVLRSGRRCGKELGKYDLAENLPLVSMLIYRRELGSIHTTPWRIALEVYVRLLKRDNSPPSKRLMALGSFIFHALRRATISSHVHGLVVVHFSPRDWPLWGDVLEVSGAVAQMCHIGWWVKHEGVVCCLFCQWPHNRPNGWLTGTFAARSFSPGGRGLWAFWEQVQLFGVELRCN